jgi:iron complex outermembrane recepter protein
MSRRTHVGVAAGLVTVLAGLSGPAQSQESAADTLALEEVVVTARKRAETLLEVPVAITALSAEDIDQKGIENLQDVALFTPGLTYFDSIQNQLGTPVIRGISQTNLNSPDRNVAIFYGGVYLANTSAGNLEILDVERIEVVKGPQSALYGRNAFNGAINFVPSRPTENLFAKAEATGGTDGRVEGKLVAAGPLGEMFGGRIALGYNKFDGTFENAVAAGPDIGGYDSKTVQGMVTFRPNERFDARIFGYYTDDFRSPSALYFFDVNNCGPNPMAFTAVCGEIPYRDTVAQAADSYGLDREVTNAALDLTFKIGSFSLVGQTGYGKAETYGFNEYTANGTGDEMQIVSLTAINAQVAMGVPFATAVSGSFPGVTPVVAPAPLIRTQRIPQYTGNPSETDTFSQEIRLESDPEKALRGSVGGFYYTNEFTSFTGAVFDARGIAATEFVRDSLGFTAGNPGLVARGDPRAGLFFTTILDRKDYQRAYFGTFEWDITESLRFGGEARHDTEDRQQQSRLIGAASLQRKEFEYNSWRYHADWAMTPQQRFYASAAKGTISGYFNPTVDAATRVPLPLELQSYDAAENRTYEIGWKAEWLDRRLSTEIALFYINYTGLQINATPPPPAVTAIIQNLGKVTSKGVELAADWRISEKFRLGLTYGYSPTEFGQNSVEPSVLRYCGGAVSPTNQSLLSGFCRTTLFNGIINPEVGGQSLPRAPEMNASVNAQFTTPLAGDWSLYARADASFQAKAYTLTWNVAEIPERTLVNARVGLRRGQALEVSLWGRNVFDEKYVTAVIFQPHFNLPITTAFVPNVSLGEGATFGLTATYKFGVDRAR